MVDDRVENDDGDFVSHILLSYDATFHFSEKVNGHNVMSIT